MIKIFQKNFSKKYFREKREKLMRKNLEEKVLRETKKIGEKTFAFKTEKIEGKIL